MSYGEPSSRPAVAPWLGVSLALLAVAAFVARRPFQGIVHDNILYVAQALRAINPSSLNYDLFFAYGSQDSFTLFSPLYGGLISAVGLDAATRLLLVCGQMLWLLCAFLLIRQVIPRHLVLLALLFLATYPMNYGGGDVFRIGEPFVTPRLFAEALGMGAIAAFLAARVSVCILLLVGAALLHPLVVFAPAAAIIITALSRHRTSWAPATVVGSLTMCALLLLIAAHALQMPFATAIDPEWRSIASYRSKHLFIAKWQVEDWLSMVGDAILVAIASLAAPPLVRRLFLALLATGLAAIFVSFVGFDLLSDLRIGQLQLWRALWLLKLFAPVGLPLIINETRRLRNCFSQPTLLYAYGTPILALLADLAGMPGLAFPPIMVLAILFLRQRSVPNAAAEQRLLVPSAHLALTLFSGLIILCLVRAIQMLPNNLLLAPSWELVFKWLLPALVLCVGLALHLRQSRLPSGVVLALLALSTSFLLWDRRSDWQRYIEKQPDLSAELHLSRVPGESVYWPGNLLAVWAGLQKASYFSQAQGAGLIFNRETATEYSRRFNIVQLLEPTNSWAKAVYMSDDPQVIDDMLRRNIAYADIKSICSQRGGPDIIIINVEIPDARPMRWHSSVDLTYPLNSKSSSSDEFQTISLSAMRDFFVYRCRTLLP